MKDQCKYKETLELLSTIENINELTADDQISFYLLQSFLYSILYQQPKALDAADLAYVKSEEIGNDLGMLDASLARGLALGRVLKTEECYNSILKCEEVIANLKDQPEKIIGKRKVDLAHNKANYDLGINKFDKSLECSKTYLALSEKYGTKLDIALAFNLIGICYAEIGDLSKGLEHFKNSIKVMEGLNDKLRMAAIYNNIGEIFRFQGDLDRALAYYDRAWTMNEEMGFKLAMAVNLENIGLIYYEKGELDKALNYGKRSLHLFKKAGINFQTSEGLFYIIPIYLERNELESAQTCLEELRKIKENEDDQRIEYRLLIAKALILKKSGGTRNIVRAADILNELSEKKSVENELLVIILLNLVEVLYIELQSTDEAEILDEIPPLITRLLEIAETTHSFSLLAEIYLFRAKLELINFQITKAQRLLTRAQQITQQYHLPRLEKKISMEHDQFLDKIDIWKELKHRNAPLSERLKRFSLEDDLNLMMRKQAIEDVEILPEEPLLLSIISKGGLSFFNHFFSKEWEKKKMFGSFMTAFNTFSHEFFSKTLDRVKIGENTIIMSPFEDKFLCYVIKGQTYPAQQKLNKFAEEIKNSKEILGAINRSFSSGILLSEENMPLLGELVNTIFV